MARADLGREAVDAVKGQTIVEERGQGLVDDRVTALNALGCL